MKYLKFMTCRLAKSVTQEEDKKKLCGKHLTVENNRYVLKLSETDAMTLGV
jgi:hypothetical protein